MEVNPVKINERSILVLFINFYNFN
jgi:hypothetical protein